jgi:hypothetical protein
MRFTLSNPFDPRTLEAQVRSAVPGCQAIVYAEYLAVREDLTTAEQAAVQATIDAHVPPSKPVPESITPAQLFVAARRLFGITSAQIESAASQVIDAIPDQNEREDARNLWHYAVQIDRSNPFLIPAAQILRLTQNQVDEIFRTGAKI